jgi:hypothetical protein
LQVFVDGALELDIAGTFGNGRLAFYNFSQGDVTYTSLATAGTSSSGAAAPSAVGSPLANWTTEDLTSGGFWKHTDMGAFVTFADLLTAHSRSVFYGTEQIMDKRIRARIQVKSFNDDDYVGCVLGFDPGEGSSAQADYLLLDWKKQTQVVAAQGTALEGLALSRVSGPGQTVGNGASIDFWDHSGDVTELARGATLGSTGWSSFVAYELEIVYTATNIEVYVDGRKEIDLQGTFGDGRFGWYDFSQEFGVFGEPLVEDI